MEFGGAGGMRGGPGRATPSTPGRAAVREERAAARRSLAVDGGTYYPAPLQLYHAPPLHDISLESFEELAVQRLKVLRAVEKQNLSGRTKLSPEWVEALTTELEKGKLESYIKLADRIKVGSGYKMGEEGLQEARRADHVSHFILRLAYCRTEELRRWFVQHETDLFRYRWALLARTHQDLLDLSVEQAGLTYRPIGLEEKLQIKEELRAATPLYGKSVDNTAFYGVHWTEAVDLVRGRRVLVKGGKAFIPAGELQSLVVGVFRARLSHGLVLTCRALPALEDDARLVGLIHSLDKRYTGEDYSSGGAGRLLPAEVEPLSHRNFPLCMKSMQQALTATHHIKYKARLQYGLFLKGIGLSLEDAMKFFRGEFIKKTDVDVDKFEKEYAYGIRYNYGKEGKKKNWQPWDCMRIIMETVGPGEHHGCPFRHHEAKTMRQRVESYGISKEDVDTIVKKVEEGHYQVACGLHYAAVHGRELSTGSVSHPNQWYLESRGEAGPGARHTNNIKTTKAQVYSQKSSQDSQKDSQELLDQMDDSELLSLMDAQT